MRRILGILLLLFAAFPLWADAVNLPGVQLSTAPLPSIQRKSPFNEMTGTLLTVDVGDRVLRITVEGGYNVDFSWDSKTRLTDHGQPLDASDLQYGDTVVVRYEGRELHAQELERLSKAPNARPAVEALPEQP